MLPNLCHLISIGVIELGNKSVQVFPGEHTSFKQSSLSSGTSEKKRGWKKMRNSALLVRPRRREAQTPFAVVLAAEDELATLSPSLKRTLRLILRAATVRGPDEGGTEDDEENSHPRSSPIPPPAKRAKSALSEVTNQGRAPRPRAAKAKLQSAASVAAGYRPAYQTSRRRAVKNS
ncbi:hypothetical protein B0H14DRAFT_2592404 [Mycena olivaceomarginata]|nr:hypothetical protein B0H14DRAFT_2592404 [Mycena olivaceomarginata]